MLRYLIIGCGGSGKSTLARSVAEICSIPYIDTDSLYWKEGWVLAEDKDVVNQLPLEADSWAIDGNFVDNRSQVWERADTIVWLDLPPSCILWRITKRNMVWWITRKATWSGNRMPLSRALSGIRHTFKQISRFREGFPEFLKEYEHKEIIIFRSQKSCDEWLERLGRNS